MGTYTARIAFIECLLGLVMGSNCNFIIERRLEKMVVETAIKVAIEAANMGMTSAYKLQQFGF